MVNNLTESQFKPIHLIGLAAAAILICAFVWYPQLIGSIPQLISSILSIGFVAFLFTVYLHKRKLLGEKQQLLHNVHLPTARFEETFGSFSQREILQPSDIELLKKLSEETLNEFTRACARSSHVTPHFLAWSDPLHSLPRIYDLLYNLSILDENKSDPDQLLRDLRALLLECTKLQYGAMRWEQTFKVRNDNKVTQWLFGSELPNLIRCEKPDCIEYNEPNANYCRSCGRGLSKLTQPVSIKCANCKKWTPPQSNGNNAKYCQHCGKEL